MDSDFTEKELSSETVFSGKLLVARKDIVAFPDGRKASREYIIHPGAAAIVPLLEGERLLLVRQYRYPIRAVTLEIPAGKIDGEESPLACAKRELQEETGYIANAWSYLSLNHPTVGYSTEAIHLFLAEDLEAAEEQLLDDEWTEPVVMSLDQALSKIREGIITDAKTIVGVLWAEKISEGLWEPKRMPLNW
jgi:ADP-ribose pyrophosphatase